MAFSNDPESMILGDPNGTHVRVDESGVWIRDADGSYIRLYNEEPGDGVKIEIHPPTAQNATEPGSISLGSTVGQSALSLAGPVLDGIEPPRMNMRSIASYPEGIIDFLSSFFGVSTGSATFGVSSAFEVASRTPDPLGGPEILDIFASFSSDDQSFRLDGDFIHQNVSQGRGRKAVEYRHTATGVINTETAIFTVTDFVLEAGRAYAVKFKAPFRSSVAHGGVLYRIRGPLLTDDYGEYGREYGSGVANEVAAGKGEIYIRNTSGSDVTRTIQLTGTPTAGSTFTVFANGPSPAFLEIIDDGDAGNCPHAFTVA